MQTHTHTCARMHACTHKHTHTTYLSRIQLRSLYLLSTRSFNVKCISLTCIYIGEYKLV